MGEIIELFESGAPFDASTLRDAMAQVTGALGGNPDTMINCSQQVAFVYLAALVARKLEELGSFINE